MNGKIVYTDVTPQSSTPPMVNGHAKAPAPSSTSAPTRKAAPKFEVECLANVPMRPVRWLWDARIAKGKITDFAGDPGLGKTTVSAAICAAVTRGLLLPPGGLTVDPGNVLFITAEDDHGDTVAPRLVAAGADMQRVSVMTERSILPRLPGGIDDIEQVVRDHHVALVVLDPIMAFLDGDAHKDQDVRGALSPLKQMAERTGAAVLMIRHLNKAQGGAALYRASGSIGIIGAARTGIILAADPDDPAGRILAVSKSNLAKRPPALRFFLDDVDVDSPEGVCKVSRVRWAGECEWTADQLLNAPRDQDKPALEHAVDVIGSLLAEGPLLSADLDEQAKAVGIKDRTIVRARKELGAKSRKVKGGQFAGQWEVYIPGHGSSSTSEEG